MPARVVPRDRWSGLGFLLAAIGSAVGVGNIWRFPYMVGINGGGAFLLAYIAGVIIFSLPLMMLELDAGRRFSGSVITTLKKIDPRFRLLGLLPVAISLGVAGYYIVVTGWSLAYFVFSFSGYIPFSDFTNSLLPIGFFLASLAISVGVISLGIRKGIQRLSLVLMPVFTLLLICLMLYSLTLPGADQGIAFYLTPDFSFLSDINIWIMGIVQAFFSLAVGYGILVTYASYLDRKEDIRRYALGIAGADTLIALIGGLIVFPIVFTFGIDPASGSGLTFLSLPLVFGTIPMGFIVGAAFFLLLFISGITSAVGFLEVVCSSIVDESSIGRKKASLMISLPVAAIGIMASLTYFGGGISLYGSPLIEFLDMFFGEMLLLSAALFSLVVTRYGKGVIFSKGTGMTMAIRILLKYVIPVVLILTFLLRLLH